MKQIKAYAGTQSVRRAVSILKSFTDSRSEWTLMDLAREVGLNKTTTFRLLSALESEGMVARSPETGAYRLGPSVIALGGVATRSNTLRTAGLAELQRVARETGEAVTLEVLVGNEVLIIEEVASARLVSSSQSVGTRHPAHATSTGKVLLSEMNEAERQAALPLPLASVTARTITDWAALSKELDEVRVRGYAQALEELESAYAAVSVPVRNHDGRILAAICVGGPVTRLGSDRLSEVADMLKEAAYRVSLNLGFNAAAHTETL
jgi:IclR family transcriptional regulator, acetate operon repressor